MKIAVTGASGFIGRHVLSSLSRGPAEVTALVRPTFTGQAPLPAAHIVKVDIHDPPDDVYELIGRPEVLIHLAWSDLKDYRSLRHYEHTLPGHYAFLKGLIVAGLPTLLVSGTCLEYGMQSGSLSEDIDTRPTTPYGFAKDSLRKQLQFLQQDRQFQLIWARLFYLYGEGQATTSIYSQLHQAAARGESVFNMSGGEQLRDYLPVEAVADALVRLALMQSNIGIINVCAGRSVTIRELVEGWIHEKNWQITPNLGHYPYPDYEPMAFWGNSYKLSSLLE